MFKDNRPRYWVDWYDRWHLLLALLLLLLLCLVGYLAITAPPLQVTLYVPPAAALRADQPVAVKGQATANSLIRNFVNAVSASAVRNHSKRRDGNGRT